MTATRTDVSGFQLYKRLLRYALPYKWVFLVAVAGMIAAAAAETSFAALLKPIMDGGFVNRDEAFIRWLPWLLIIIFFARGIGEFVDSYCMSWVGRRVIFDLRGQMFDRLIRLPSKFYDHHSSANLVSKLIYDVEQVAQASTSALRIFIRDSLTTIALFSWMCYLSLKLTLVFLVVGPLVGLVVRVASKRFRDASRRIQASMGGIAHVAKEAFQGQRVVKSFGGHQYETKTFKRANSFNRRQAMKKAAVAAASVPLIILVAGAAVAVIIVIATSSVTSDAVTAGTFVSYLGAMLMLMSPIKRLARVNEIIQNGVAASGSVFGLMDEAPERDDGTRELERAKGRIEFRDVVFRYDENTETFLDHISFTIEPGQTVALVGHSGSGKSTIASLLLRFYRPDDGEIALDGIPINELTLAALRTNISIVTQETILFDDSIRRNIAYGSAASIDEARLHDAAQAAHVLEFVEQTNQGLDTVIGEQGIRLSGGQRQRIAIARALYKDAPILIMDEATSALDSESERLVREATQTLIKNRTTLIIAHRLSTIEQADKILVLDAGKIVEQGRHNELIQKGGAYAKLHSTQFSSSNGE